MSITYLDPSSEATFADEPYALATDTRAAGLRVGLLANSFPGAVPFMAQLETALREKLPGATFIHFQKPGVTRVRDELADEIGEQCDVSVAAWGH